MGRSASKASDNPARYRRSRPGLPICGRRDGSMARHGCGGFLRRSRVRWRNVLPAIRAESGIGHSHPVTTGIAWLAAKGMRSAPALRGDRVRSDRQPKRPTRSSGNGSTAFPRPTKTTLSDAPRKRHGVHHPWWTLPPLSPYGRAVRAGLTYGYSYPMAAAATESGDGGRPDPGRAGRMLPTANAVTARSFRPADSSPELEGAFGRWAPAGPEDALRRRTQSAGRRTFGPRTISPKPRALSARRPSRGPKMLFFGARLSRAQHAFGTRTLPPRSRTLPAGGHGPQDRRALGPQAQSSGSAAISAA